ncbi:hypothetical protein BGX27_001432 [Mortierella sp. AM989]|nr:hypothetical protein BGX27_001432 [Mortierella sp. AM989]
MSTLFSSSSLRPSKSTSTFPSQSKAHDQILQTRRASSEGSMTLPRSTTVSDILAKDIPLSSSSSTQSSLSFVTSNSSSKAATDASAVSNNVIMEQLSMKGHECNEEVLAPIPLSLKKPNMMQSSIPSSSTRPISSSGETWLPPTSGSRSTSASPGLERQHPQPPIFFGDYLFPENPTLRDLQQVFLLDKSSKQKDFRQSLQLHAHLMGLALSARVSRGLDLAYDHAHDAFKNKQRPDRRNEFISTFSYTHDETERILHHALAHPQPRPSFLDMISPSSSTAILIFLHRLRTDHTILATAFQNLQPQELDVLLLPERPSLATLSQAQLRGNRERSYSAQAGVASHAGQQPQTHQQTPGQQRQLQLQGLVPNYVNNQDIVQIILANLFGPSSFAREHKLRVQAVKSIFVTLISEKKGERLMTEMLERYVVQSEWHHSSRVRAGFEKTLLDIIHRGEIDLTGFSDEELNTNVLPHQHQNYYSLGKTSNAPMLRAAVSDTIVTAHIQHGVGPRDPTISPTTTEPNLPQPEMTARQAMVEEFYLEACLDILDTLAEFSPPCLMELSRLIFAGLDQSSKPYASLVIIVKFFFYRFMNKCIAYPETYGMLHDIFISEKQRQRILFTTHQRLYRYVTGILNPVPGWENRASTIDPRIREKIESFVSLFSSSDESKESPSLHYTLYPIAELSAPAPVPENLSQRSAVAASPGVTPFLLLCPSDFTTLFYFICPNLRTTTSSSGSPAMTRSSSFSGKSNVMTRQRTSSDTPPTYPAAMRAASSTTTGTSGVGPTIKLSHPPSSTRIHRRASPSFSFFSGATASLPFKSRPPQPHLTLEKVPSAPAEPTMSGSTILSLSGIKPGQAASPKTAAVEVTSTAGIAAASCVFPSSGSSSQGMSSDSSSSYRSSDSIMPIKHWTDKTLLPDLKSAILELRKAPLGSVKEVPWVVNNPGLTPLREPWALAYVQYGDETHEDNESGDTAAHLHGHQERTANSHGKTSSPKVLVEVGLALAPSCMAMVMENSAIGGGSRIVTVTKPMLVDQVMDSAGSQSNFESNVDLDFEVEESDNESLLSSEDTSLSQRQHYLTAKDKDMSILRVNSSHMLSLTDESGTKSIPVFKAQDSILADEGRPRANTENPRSSTLKRAAADRAWKSRIRQTVHLEADLPEEIRTVARSVFKILREFDVLVMDEHEEEHWSQPGYQSSPNVRHASIRALLSQGIEQARHFGNHAAAIGFHHSLRILESSSVLRQLDSPKVVYLLAMPIKHRLEHRTGRARSRTLWEGFAHSWHTRLVSAIERKRESLSSLRVKMYYQTCVRTSRAFEKSLGIIVTLSRMNKVALRKYLSAEEWERCNGQFPVWNEMEAKSGAMRYPTCDNPGCKGSCLDQHCQMSNSEAAEIAFRRYSANSGYNPHLKVPKVRRSSFSTYIDNMTSRSFGPSSLLESSLSHLKEKEQASFSSSYNSGHQVPWPGNNGSQAGSIGSLNETADIQGDFTMDARETEAVQRWITDAGIHNFLPGEDNFLRFCMEVEHVVRGVGLGGTGIQGAGVPQAQNGTMLPGLSSSGSDFFVKEVAKFNGQFIAGMGPSDQTVQTKSSGGVAEFLANSFKHGHSASSVPTTTGNYFFSQAGSSANSTHGTLNSNSSSSSSQSSVTSTNGNGVSSVGGRSKGILRQVLNNNHHMNAQEPIPVLQDDPDSIYAFSTGPTYALYNPPYSTSSHGASSSYSGSLVSGGAGSSSTTSPHQISQLPKDMAEFLRRIQLTLTSYVLSEWLDLFGEVEADRWFVEFLDEMGMKNSKSNSTDQDDTAVLDTNQDEYFVPLNQMDARDKAQDEQCISLSTKTNLAELSRPTSSARSSLHSLTESNPPVSNGSSWHARNPRGDTWTEESSHQPLELTADSNDQDGCDTIRPSVSASTFSTARSSRNSASVTSVLSTAADLQKIPGAESLSCDTFTTVDQRTAVYALDEYHRSNQSLSEMQAKNHAEKGPPANVESISSIDPYDLTEAYWSTMEQFNSAKSPYQKLGHLFALELLIVASLSYPDSCDSAILEVPTLDKPQGKTKSTSKGHDQSTNGNGSLSPESPRAFTPGTDAIVNEIENLFRKPGILRPRHLLRDMQLIATFIPGTILDLRDDGKAFWDMALAISSLKSEVIEYIVQKGTQYVEVEESSRTSQQESDRDDGSRPITQDDEERARMSEAVRLFTIGARESHPVAQRELAILYMSLPMLPSSASPPMGYSPLINQISRMPSPISITTSKFVGSSILGSSAIIGGKGSLGRTNTPPPSTSPKGAFSSSFMGRSSTASIPIKQKARHQHSSSGSGSSFGSGMLSGLGIMTGLGSFTGSSSIGSGGSNEGLNNSSTASLTQHQHPLGEFAEGHHDVDQYQEVHPGRQSLGVGCGNGIHSHHPRHSHRQHPHQQQQYPPNSSDPDKYNPENVAAAMHWFTLAAAQGDKFSINYLKHKETAGGMLGNLG